MGIDIRQILGESRVKLDQLRSFLDLEGKQLEIARLEQLMSEPGFWDRPAEARDRIQKLKASRHQCVRWQDLRRATDDLGAMVELVDETGDPEAETEATRIAQKLERDMSAFELTSFFASELDSHDAVVAIHPGAGGTESQDWAEMLLRMYLRWAEENGFKTSMLDYQEGEEAGIKDATIEIQGEYAYGYLQSESGVHRLVRISPYDASKRRHTSFASIFVLPQVDELTDVEIPDEELRVDTFRASGAGGQHVNKTDSAVRITHSRPGWSSSPRRNGPSTGTGTTRCGSCGPASSTTPGAGAEEARPPRGREAGHRLRKPDPFLRVPPLQSGQGPPDRHETSDVQGVMNGDLNPFIDAWLRTRNRPLTRGDRG